MISRKIEYLLWVIGTDNTQLAAYAGCSESNFSRLKSGSRKPSRNSLTIKKFVAALYTVAKDKQLLGALQAITGEPDDNRQEIQKALTDWLFDESEDMLPYSPWGIDAKAFGLKLTKAMKAAGISSSRLSRLANIDPSYISRMKSGDRMPKSNTELIERICRIIAAKAQERGTAAELFELTGSKGKPDSSLSAALFAWLYEKKSTDGAVAISNLIEKIAVISEVSAIPEKQQPGISRQFEKLSSYTGTSGLQQAVARFLSDAASGEDRQLLLYSDQPMGWLTGDFRQSWEELMLSCLKAGVRIKIIHNIDRSTSEMFEAISSWLPLYITGLIEPYYCTARNGERFYTTLFLDRSNACISGHFIKGMENQAPYSYITEKSELEYFDKSFDELMHLCRPLMRISKESSPISGNYSIYRFDNVQIYVGREQVILSRLGDPVMSFIFEHPLIVKAFRAYLASSKNDRI